MYVSLFSSLLGDTREFRCSGVICFCSFLSKLELSVLSNQKPSIHQREGINIVTTYDDNHKTLQPIKDAKSTRYFYSRTGFVGQKSDNRYNRSIEPGCVAMI